jgi:hypothetical protein
LIRIDSHIYSRSSWSFTSKQSELVDKSISSTSPN